MKPPLWLEEFQRSFSAILRTPLDSTSGTLQSILPSSSASLEVVPRSTRPAAAGLSDYHRQYWFRLLTALQQEFPLTARLLGLWSFNLLAQKYLQNYPPQHHDLQSVRQNFLRFLHEADQPRHLLQAACIDEARSQVFMAPSYQPWQWQEEESAKLALKQLKAAPDWRIIHEDWPLVELCLRLDTIPGEGAVPCPEACQTRQTWFIQREGQGLLHRPLSEVQGRLYELLTQRTIQDALEAVEQEYLHLPSAELQASVQSWMAQSVTWGLWAA